MNHSAKQTILVLGASGLLGNAVLRVLAQSQALNVVGTLRSDAVKARLQSVTDAALILPVDATRFSDLQKVMDEVRPGVLVNCIGATKHIDAGNDPSIAYMSNAVLPHSLAALTANAGCRLIHISTDCVFKGDKGMYRESDPTDATDVYGQSKAAGEVHYRNSITVRTSIIGHEIDTRRSLVEWFMMQGAECKGFRKAFFSGFPTVTLARIIRDHVIPHPEMHGLWHAAAPRVGKFDLLSMIAKTYGKQITIRPDDTFELDRSLDGSRFREATGFVSPDWPALVAEMYEDRQRNQALFRQLAHDAQDSHARFEF